MGAAQLVRAARTEASLRISLGATELVREQRPRAPGRAEGVGLFEQSSFAKILVQGRDAERALNRIATADCRVPSGSVRYAQFLNERGGIEADVSITRLATDRFMVVTAAFTATHVIAWLREHIAPDCQCVVTEVSDAWCMLNVQGPRSRELLSGIASGDWSNEAFPFGTAREVQIGYQQALAVRITYVGELGWELYVPVPFAIAVYDAVVEAGKPLGLRRCGYHALNSLRIEKAYRDWSHDIGPDDTPLDAGLAFTCAWSKPEGFIGRDALLAVRSQPRRRRLVQFLLSDPGEMLYHNEPILLEGKRVGLISSGMFAHTLGAAAGLGYVSDERGVTDELIGSGRFEILIGNRSVPARASLRPLYDPGGLRPRS
jgi:4-methylaminobutanoate oxidase (formaldehyde-forming)